MRGLEESRVLLCHILAVLIISRGVNSFMVIRSTTQNGHSDVDRFSNPTCRPWHCRFSVQGSVGCSTGNCCFCQCDHRTPNYVMYARMCKPNDEVDEECGFSVTQDDAPMRVQDMTKAGKVQFHGDLCDRGLRVRKWSYRLNGRHWIEGSQNNFRIESVSGNEYSWSLQWNRGLDAKYAGLILKFDFACGIKHAGCLLIKSKGNYTIPGSLSSSPLPPLKPSDVAIDATGGNTGPTRESGTSSRTNEKVNPAAETKRELEAKHTGIVVAGVTVSLAAGIVLVLATFLFKVKRRGSWNKDQRRNTPSVAYEEPIERAARPGHATSNAATFHNELYDSDCVLSISSQSTVTRISGLGPLPPLPAEEGIYEEPAITRNVKYQGLEKDKRDDGSVGDAISTNQGQPPEYNILEAPATDDPDYDYDDNIAECRNTNV